MIALLLLTLLGCGPVEITCDDLYGEVTGVGALLLTEEHPGWGEPACLTCHSIERMHRVNCTDMDGLELQSVRDLVEREGEASCAACHGDNGVDG